MICGRITNKKIDTENDTQNECAEKADAEEITREGYDLNKMAGPSGADYVVDDAE